MPRISRIDVGGEIYHVLNRANARAQIFDDESDYAQFEEILEEAVQKYKVHLYAYCLMPNHWHFVLHPERDGDLSRFMSWLTNTHTRRWHVVKETVGQGHLYQGRYKSFLCEQEDYLFVLLRYVERNAKTAGLVKKAEDWRWSSVWRREFGTTKQKQLLSEWPYPIPQNYLTILNEPMTLVEIEKIEKSEERSIPFGRDSWINTVVKKYNIEQVLRRVGRPKKGG